MSSVVNIPMLSHEDVCQLLPDYATGVLEESQMRALSHHLSNCERCSRELSDVLETTSFIVDAGAPRAEVRRALIVRVESGPMQAPAFEVRSAPTPFRRIRSADRRRLLAVAWAAAALFLVAALALGGWNYLLLQEREQQDRIAGLITARSLTDSALDTGATGVIYVNPESDQALLVASGLPPLSSDRRYQIWFFTADGQHVSAGFFPVNASGVGQGLITAPEPLRAYHAVALSAEPATGSSAPTAPLSLGGWIQ